MSQADRWRDWEARVADYKSSGLSKARWCRKHEVKQLYFWLDRLRDARARLEAPAQWARLTVADPEVFAAVFDIKVGQGQVRLRS